MFAGEFYAEHYDNRAGGVITRAATIIVYLDDTSEGGATYFPRSTGLPEDGAAVARRPPAALAALSQALHASRTALRPGLKVRCGTIPSQQQNHA